MCLPICLDAISTVFQVYLLSDKIVLSFATQLVSDKPENITKLVIAFLFKCSP